MRQLSLVACLVVVWIVPASAMPIARPNDLGTADIPALVKVHGHGHGHHWGWGRGHGHHYGWWHGHHHGWRH